MGENESSASADDVALDQHLALGVGGERIGRVALATRPVTGGAVHAARRHVDEALDPGRPRHRCQPQAPEVVDVVRDVLAELADGIVRHFGEVDQRVEPGEVVGGDVAGVLGDHGRAPISAVVEPSDTMEARVETHHVVATTQEVVGHADADVAVGAGEQDPRHVGRPRAGGRSDMHASISCGPSPSAGDADAASQPVHRRTTLTRCPDCMSPIMPDGERSGRRAWSDRGATAVAPRTNPRPSTADRDPSLADLATSPTRRLAVGR